MVGELLRTAEIDLGRGLTGRRCSTFLCGLCAGNELAMTRGKIVYACYRHLKQLQKGLR